MVGKVFDGKKHFFLRVHVGECRDEKRNTFELSTGGNDGCPIIYDKEKSRFFVLSWNDIMKLASTAFMEVDEIGVMG